MVALAGGADRGAAAEVVRAPETTVADLSGPHRLREGHLQEVERLRAVAAASADSPGMSAAAHRRTVVGSVAGVVGARRPRLAPGRADSAVLGLRAILGQAREQRAQLRGLGLVELREELPFGL